MKPIEHLTQETPCIVAEVAGASELTDVTVPEVTCASVQEVHAGGSNNFDQVVVCNDFDDDYFEDEEAQGNVEEALVFSSDSEDEDEDEDDEAEEVEHVSGVEQQHGGVEVGGEAGEDEEAAWWDGVYTE